MVRPHITKRLFNRRRRGWRFIRRCLLGWRHRADDAVGPLKNDPINRCDRATARVDHDAHLNVAVIEDAQHVHRSLFLGFCQRKVSGSAHNCVDSVGRQKNRQSTRFSLGAGSGDGDWAKHATVTRRKQRVSVGALNTRAITTYLSLGHNAPGPRSSGWLGSPRNSKRSQTQLQRLS